jgi:hypothetical protein
MTSYAQRLFYVNKPTLDDKDAFNSNCAGIIQEAAVLGCYHGDRGGIHVYDVTDDRLQGIEEVTAAHEMLHQAYDRLNGGKRERIDDLLQQFYDEGLSDQSIRDKLGIYQQEGVHDLANEMHSIFGTEVAELPVELEEYYRQYFSDRQQVVAFRMASRAAFDDYRNQITTYDDRLRDLQAAIDKNEAELSRRLARINQTRAELDGALDSGNVEQYNAGVPAFNALVSSYNGLLQETQGLVEEYNQLVIQRNAIAVQVTELNQALDSRFTPQ